MTVTFRAFDHLLIDLGPDVDQKSNHRYQRCIGRRPQGMFIDDSTTFDQTPSFYSYFQTIVVKDPSIRTATQKQAKDFLVATFDGLFKRTVRTSVGGFSSSSLDMRLLFK
ncbi:hypothetical protein J4E81_009486 [Alternaria sp. BMP 2799]|nr:hypothetical protein J4E81_009486 [Alternaria sp. BMP 2799]